MSVLRAVRLLSANALGVFPLAHAVTDVYISLGHKNMPPMFGDIILPHLRFLTVQR